MCVCVCLCVCLLRYVKLDAWMKGPVYDLREAALHIVEFMAPFFVKVGGSPAPSSTPPFPSVSYPL